MKDLSETERLATSLRGSFRGRFVQSRRGMRRGMPPRGGYSQEVSTYGYYQGQQNYRRPMTASKGRARGDLF